MSVYGHSLGEVNPWSIPAVEPTASKFFQSAMTDLCFKYQEVFSEFIDFDEQPEDGGSSLLKFL
jgi:hypothetical protein